MYRKLFSPRHSLYAVLALCVWLGFTVSAAQADIISTETLLDERAAGDLRAELVQALERSDVIEKLQAFGVQPEQAAERVNALTEQEAQQLALQFEALPAGGDVALLLVIIIIILLIR